MARRQRTRPAGTLEGSAATTRLDVIEYGATRLLADGATVAPLTRALWMALVGPDGCGCARCRETVVHAARIVELQQEHPGR